MRHAESKLQQACVKWFRLQHSDKARCLFAIPNGGYRSPIEAKIMQGEGVTPGVADCFLMYPVAYYHGLFIEFKQGKGKQTDHQYIFQTECFLRHYHYVVVRTFDEFVTAIDEYLHGKV